METNDKQAVDQLAQAIFAALERLGRLKPPAVLAVAQGLSGGPRRTASRSATVWQDYRPEARQILQKRS